MLQTLIFTKNFPKKTKVIKKNSKSTISKKINNHITPTPTNLTLICIPEKTLRVIQNYIFPGEFVIVDHLTIENSNGCFGYYEVLKSVKKITSLTLLENKKLLEINFSTINHNLTPFGLFEDRMKSLGSADALKFSETIQACLNHFQMASKQSLMKSTLTQHIQLENYKIFKNLIRNKTNDYILKKKCFIIILLNTDSNATDGSVKISQNYFSEELFKIIYDNNDNFLYDMMRDGVPDFYCVEGNYYEQMTLLFRKMFLNDQSKLQVSVNDCKGEKLKANLECETLGFQAEGYQEYVAFHKLEFNKKDINVKVESEKCILRDVEKTQKIKNVNENKIETENENERTNEYLFNANLFKKSFYPKKLPLNKMEENKHIVCSFKNV